MQSKTTNLRKESPFRQNQDLILRNHRDTKLDCHRIVAGKRQGVDKKGGNQDGKGSDAGRSLFSGITAGCRHTLNAKAPFAERGLFFASDLDF